jgi:hypothetical protein
MERDPMDNIVRFDIARRERGLARGSSGRARLHAEAQLKRWLDAQVSPFARHAARARRSAKQQPPPPEF